MRARLLLVIALVGAVVGTASRVSAQTPGPFPLSPVVESSTVHAGTTVRAILKVDIPPGLHMNSNAPRDPSLIGARVSFEAPPGITIKEVVYPKSDVFEVKGFGPIDVFSGELLIGVQFVLGKDVPAGPLTIPARFGYQACDDNLCYQPRRLDTSWTMEVVAANRPVARQNPALFGQVAFGSGQPPPASAASPTAGASTTSTPAATETPEQVLKLFDEFEIAGSTGGYLNTADFLQFIRDAEAGVKPKGMFEGRGPLTILAIVFLGGLLLNLTPCVLPMIPINLAIIGAGSQGKSRGRGFALGLVYGAAMAVVYGVIGLVVILTAGTFGGINSSAWFNAGIALLFVVLGLAMFDVINIDFSRLSSKIQFKQESRGTMMLAFGMGAVAALLAGACVAPVVIQVVVFSSDLYAKGTAAALALPFVLGIGMAVPWPLAGAGIASLPKPGLWMVRVKQAMGVFILGTAVYYGYVAYEILSSRWVDPASVAASVEAQLKEGWQASMTAGLQKAKAERTPVLVDFWATWCKNCLTMDKTTLAEPSVKQALATYTKIKFQADDLDASPARELMQRVGAKGLPHYAILKPR